MNVWIYIFIVSIPILVGIFFAISFFMIKDKEYGKLPKVLGLFACNPESVISFVIIITIMTLTVIILQILAYSDLYDKNEVCVPILYYFGGNKDGCKQAVARRANIQTQIYNIQSKIDEMKNYRPNSSSNKNGGIFEQFVGARNSASSTFSNIVNEFDITYKWYVKQIILYAIKVYRDIFLPWIKK